MTEIRLPAGRERARLDAIAGFNALVGTQKPLDDPSADRLGAARLQIVLQALDGFRAGLSQRAIAETLFGAQRVQRDWSDGGSHMRDHVRRAIRRGRKLMAGDYISLLR